MVPVVFLSGDRVLSESARVRPAGASRGRVVCELDGPNGRHLLLGSDEELMSVSPWTEVRDRDDDLARHRQERDVTLLDGCLVGYRQLPSL